MWTLQHDDEEEEAAAGASSSAGPGPGSQLPHPGLQRNDYFVFFDADPGSEKKAKKKQKLAGDAVQDWDDDD